MFLSSLERQREETRRNGEKDRTEAEGGWQGVSESAVSAKRGWGSFGAKPAQSETSVRAAAKRRPPGRGRSGGKMALLTAELKWGCRWLVGGVSVEARNVCSNEM